MNVLKAVNNTWKTAVFQNLQQFRSKHVNRWMIRDVKRRKMVTEYAPMRLRYLAMKRNDILPQEIIEKAEEDLLALPRDSFHARVTNRCAVTSRPRGVLVRWRLSRIVFRHLVDYNKLSGVQRAIW